MEMLYVKRGFCGCVSLGTSVQVIACVDGLILLSSIWNSIRDASQTCSTWRSMSKDHHENLHYAFNCHEAVLSIVTLLWGFFAVILLLAGVFKRQRFLLLPYMFTAGIGIIYGFYLTFSAVISSTAGILTTIYGIFSFGVHVFFYLHVISFHYHLKMEKGGKFI